MAICTFYQQGRCKFGDKCKFEHPGAQTQSAFSSPNRFGVFGQAGGGRGPTSGGGFGGGRKDDIRDNKYSINPDDIKADLTAGKNRPEWIFSAYAPGRNAPIQLFGGPQREQSFEEMRSIHYAAVAAGNPEKAIQDANNLYAETEAQIRTILNDVEGAVRYLLDGENTHPNRIDVCEGKTGPGFGTGAGAAAPSPFGQPSALGQPQTQGPTFGQPSGFGQASASTFGQPAALGQPAQAPAFGKPAFGQPSTFGQPSALGAGTQTTQLGQSTFGKPSTFGQPAFGQSAFSQPSQNQVQPNPLGGAFGQPSTAASSPFSQLANQNQQQQQQQQQPATGFGAFANQNQSASGFGQTQPQANPFGQLGGFGQPSQPAQPTLSGFGTQKPATTAPPFGQPSGGFGAPAPAPAPATAPKKDPKDLNPLPPLSGSTNRDPSTKKLLTWKGQAVQYIENEPCYQHPDDPATFVRIYFPDGPPQADSLRDALGKEEEYTPEVEGQYKFFKEQGKWKDGVVPLVPPKVEWCSFDF